MSDSIKRLNKKHPNYSLNVEVTSGPQGKSQVKAMINVLEALNEEQLQIVLQKQSSLFVPGKAATGYGIGETIQEAQEAAVDAAVKNLGL